MSHRAQVEFCGRMRKTRPDLFVRARVLDVGSLDVNGNNRWLFTNPAIYTGIDLVEGKGVDRVCSVHEIQTKYDFVICTEVLEHDPDWERTLGAIADRVDAGGALLLTCAGPGRPEHGTRKNPVEGMPCDSDYYFNLSVQHLLSVLQHTRWQSMLTEMDNIACDTRIFAIKP